MEKDRIKTKNPDGASLIVPGATVFVSSSCIMILELTAARLIARNLGSSLYTWTAVIGVVLAGISLGNSVGGRIADRYAAKKALAVLFTIASAACVFTVILNNLVGGLMWLWVLSWPARVFTHVLLVFMIPSTILGTVSPVVAKMALDRGLPTGRTVGAVYAWGAVGSIAGTFVTGYWLIDAMGTVPTLWAVAAVLLLLAVLYAANIRAVGLWAAAFFCLAVLAAAPSGWCRRVAENIQLREILPPELLYMDETPYCQVAIQQRSVTPDIRIFSQDKLVHSSILVDDITNLQYPYTKVYAAVTQSLSVGKEKLRVMAIGGGGYVFPRYVEKIWPGSLIEVVEIDPGVTEAAMAAFGLPRDTTIKTITMDARNYVDQVLHPDNGGKRYDFIYGDAFNDYSAPFQLVTKEFHDKLRRLLGDDGAYIATVIDILDSSRFLSVFVNTLRRSFAHVYVLAEAGMPPWSRNTFVVVACQHPVDMTAVAAKYGARAGLWFLDPSQTDALVEKAGGLVLTDDYAPVENLLAGVVRESGRGFLAGECIKRAQTLQQAGKIKECIANYKKAAQVMPQLTTDIYHSIGLVYLGREDYEQAVEAFNRAIEYNQQTAAERNIASTHFNLGLALQKLGRAEQSREQLLKAAEGYRTGLQVRPDSATLYGGLGSALLVTAHFDEAADAFRRAIDLAPANAANYVSLAQALQLQGLHEDAVSILQGAIEYMEQNGRQENAEPLKEYLKELQTKQSPAPQPDVKPDAE